MTPRNDAAFSQKTVAGPDAATIRPPTAGPVARARLNPALLSATAVGSSRRGTSSGTIACQAGALSAPPRPIRNVSVSRIAGVIKPSMVSTPSSTATASIQVCVRMTSQRRSTISAIAPAGKPTKNSGRFDIVVSSATGTGELVSDVMSQAAATPCMSEPMFEARAASQSARKTGRASGPQAELACVVVSAVCDLVLFYRVSFSPCGAKKKPVGQIHFILSVSWLRACGKYTGEAVNAPTIASRVANDDATSFGNKHATNLLALKLTNDRLSIIVCVVRPAISPYYYCATEEYR